MTAKGLERTDAGTKKYDESEDNRNDGINNENDSAEPAKPAPPADSTRYRYEPARQEEPVKSEVKAITVPVSGTQLINFNIHDLASSFIQMTLL